MSGKLDCVVLVSNLLFLASSLPINVGKVLKQFAREYDSQNSLLNPGKESQDASS